MKLSVEARFLRNFVLRDRPIYAHFAITHRCNLRCAACATWRLADEAKELSLGEIEELVALLGRLGCKQISLSGGEPVMRRDLPQIVGLCRRAGLRARVLTNGVAMTPAIADELLAAGLKEISFSLDSLNREVQETIDLAKGTYDTRLDNLFHLARRLPLRGAVPLLNAIVNRLNIDELPRLVEFAERIGFYISFVPLHQPTGEQKGHRFYQPQEGLAFRAEDEPRVRTMYETLLHAKRNGKPILNSSAFLAATPDFFFSGRVDWPCRAGSLYLSIGPDGFVSPCHAFEEQWGAPYRDFERWSFSSEVRRELPQRLAACEGCFRPCWAEISFLALNRGSLREMLQLHWRARRAKSEINEPAVRDWLSAATGQSSCASC